jgi:hypothetical protein
VIWRLAEAARSETIPRRSGRLHSADPSAHSPAGWSRSKVLPSASPAFDIMRTGKWLQADRTERDRYVGFVHCK